MSVLFLTLAVSGLWDSLPDSSSVVAVPQTALWSALPDCEPPGVIPGLPTDVPGKEDGGGVAQDPLTVPKEPEPQYDWGVVGYGILGRPRYGWVLRQTRTGSEVGTPAPTQPICSGGT